MAWECGGSSGGGSRRNPNQPPPAPRPQVVKNNLSPVWEPFKVSLSNLCSCEETRPLKVGQDGPGAGEGSLLQGDGDLEVGSHRGSGLRGPGLPSASSGIMTPAESTTSSGNSPPPLRRCRKLSGRTR